MRYPALSPLEKRVVETLDPDALLSTLSEWIAIPTVANAETPGQEAVAARMESYGLRTDVWEIDFSRLREHPAYTVDIAREEGLGVVGTLGDAAGPTLILNGHIDVVPAGEVERWTRPPFELTREGDTLRGRGVADMKGALACAVVAARAIADAGVRLEGSLQIQSVIGEEDGGAGTLATLERGHTGDGALVLEPTGLVIAPAQAGALGFRITVPGLAAHGALREEGVDPVEKFIPVFEGLRALEAARNSDVADPLFAGEALPYALTMGRLEAGIWASTVAERLVAEGRYGVAPGEDLGAARALLETAVAEVADSDPWLRANPPSVEWVGAQFEPARTATDDPVVKTVSAAHRAVTGAEPALAGVRFGADMRLLVNEGGIPTAVYGPGDVREAHRPDESISFRELVEAARVLAVTAMRFCGTR